MDLIDAWDRGNNTPAYTHFTATGAARIDRIYITRPLLEAKKNTLIHATAFTDHFAVILHIERPPVMTPRGRGYWKLNASLFQDSQTSEAFKHEWEIWKRGMTSCQTTTHWWTFQVKPKIRKLFQRLGSERTSNHKYLENFYYAAIYELIRDDCDNKAKMAASKSENHKI
jgi:hypothetical protein